MYQRSGKAAYRANLDNIIALCDHLGNPQNQFKTIHIAGTNGKGSTSHILASILQENGWKVGLYTSPHLKDFRERIKLNGEFVSKEYVVNFVKTNKKLFDKLEPSFFEMTVAMAFSYFRDKEVDVAIIETGMGGRLDATNIILPELSVITNIGLDHTQFLGDTLEKIAAEKGGIIKPGIPVVIGEKLLETTPVFEQIAAKKAAPIYFTDQEVTIEIDSDLKAGYQQKNLRTSMRAIEILKKYHWKIHTTSVIEGLQNVKQNTNLLGRWQQLGENPSIFCDCGHNEAGIREVVQQIAAVSYQKLHIVLGVVKDKDVNTILDILPKTATYYFCEPNLDRAMSKQALKKQASNYLLFGDVYDSVSSAFKKAKQEATKEDFIFVGGSTFVVAEVI